MSNALRVLWVDGQRSVSVAWMLAAREWIADFRQSRMSLLWPVMQPLAYTLLFVLLRPVIGGATQTNPAGFAVFVFVGFSLWQTWFEVLRAQMDALRKHRGLMSRGELGTATLALATGMSAGIQLLPRLLLAAIASLIVLDAAPSALVGLVCFSLLVLVNGSVIGAMLQPFATLSPDLGKTIQSLSLGLMVTGAVFIPVPSDPPIALKALFAANPMGTLLNAARGPLFGDAVLNPTMVLAWVVFTVVMAMLLPAIGRRVLPIVIERMGG